MEFQFLVLSSKMYQIINHFENNYNFRVNIICNVFSDLKLLKLHFLKKYKLSVAIS